MPLTYAIGAGDVLFSFDEFTVTPSDCTLDGTALKVIYTPFING